VTPLRLPRRPLSRPRPSSDSSRDRGVSPVVGVVLVVGLTVLLAATVAGLASVDAGIREPAPGAAVDAELSATDGWPDGQRLRLVHRAGERLAVADLAVVVTLPRVDASPRLTGLPTRRLAGEHVDGRDIFDGTNAGVDGALDAADSDGYWTSGEATSVRIAQRAVDVRPGDRVVVRVIHRPTGGVVARAEAVAE